MATELGWELEDHDRRIYPIGMDSPWPRRILAGILVLLVGLTGFLIAMMFADRWISVSIDREVLRIRGDLYGRAIPWSDLITGDARLLSVGRDEPWGAVRRTNGTALPTYRSGWFRLRSGESGLLFVTDAAKAVAIPTRNDYVLIVSPADPQEFLSLIRADPHPEKSIPLAASPPAPGYLGILLLLPLLLLLGVALFLSMLMRSMGRTRIVVDESGLAVESFAYGRKIAWSKIDLDSIRTADLRTDTTYRNILRINGVGLPGYLVGWFRGWKTGSLLLFVTRQDRCAVIPTHEKFVLIVSPDDLDGFLSALSDKSPRTISPHA